MLEWISHRFGIEDGQLIINGNSLPECDSPYFIYDPNIIIDQHNKLSTALPEFYTFYAMKANPNPEIVSLLTNLGCGIELASGGEINLLEQNGIKAKIVFAGPGKTAFELNQAKNYGIYSLNVESENEINIANKLGIPYSIRINPNWKINENITMVSGGGAKQFGIDREKLNDLLKNVDKSNAIGLHVFIGSGILNHQEILNNYAKIFELAAEMNESFKVKCIDFGGGFGVPYTPNKEPLNMITLKQDIDGLLKQYSNLASAKKIIEPGRYLTAKCGVYITCVVDVKESRGTNFIICEGGINHLLRPVLIGVNHPTYIVNKLDQEPIIDYDICGPICSSVDVIAHNVKLPKVEKGDLVGMFNSGSYGYTESMPNFLLHPPAKQFMALDDGVFLMDKLSKFIANQYLASTKL